MRIFYLFFESFHLLLRRRYSFHQIRHAVYIYVQLITTNCSFGSDSTTCFS